MMWRIRRIHIFIFSVLVLILILWRISPPLSFPSGTLVEISPGMGLHELAEKLEANRVIRSPLFFRVAAVLIGGERRMQAGEYYMTQPQNTFLIAWRVLHGKHEIKVVRLTIPEGFTVKKISGLFDERFIFFDNREFESLASEGYLFPDTYFIPITATASSTIKLLRDNFARKVNPVVAEAKLEDKTLDEIVTMASIIEGEANTKLDRDIVSGILWKRIELDLPLQVDATFVYYNGKATKDLTLEDLETASPYNTYLNLGLPPTPIGNPGLESILAALYPTSTPYLYFLTGDDGKMYYSRTHDEHVEKKAKYIN